MGFGKYTTEERKIVHKISALMIKMSYHKRKAIDQRAEIDVLIDKLGPKYVRQC